MTPSVSNNKPGETPASTVLVVDDEPSLLKALERTLKGAGYEVSTAPDAEQALAILPEVDPQVVVTDLILPRMDGIDLLRQIKETAPGAEVLLMTGHASIERAVEAMRLGAFDFVEKPIDRPRLLRLVDKALERQSQIKGFKYFLQCTPMLIRGFFWRLKFKYLYRDFHPLLMFYWLGLLLLY